MASNVKFRFKAEIAYGTVSFDGHFVTVAELKRLIGEKKGMPAEEAASFLELTDATSKRVLADDNEQVMKNTAVIVRRAVSAAKPKLTVQRSSVAAPALTGIPLGAGSGVSAAPQWTEEDELGVDLLAKAAEGARHDSVLTASAYSSKMYESSSLAQGGRGGRGSAAGGRGRGRGPPPEYRCSRCNLGGHYLSECPTHGNPFYDRNQRPPTGVPTSLLHRNADGSLVVQDGQLASNSAGFAKLAAMIGREPTPELEQAPLALPAAAQPAVQQQLLALPEPARAPSSTTPAPGPASASLPLAPITVLAPPPLAQEPRSSTPQAPPPAPLLPTGPSLTTDLFGDDPDHSMSTQPALRLAMGMGKATDANVNKQPSVSPAPQQPVVDLSSIPEHLRGTGCSQDQLSGVLPHLQGVLPTGMMLTEVFRAYASGRPLTLLEWEEMRSNLASSRSSGKASSSQPGTGKDKGDAAAGRDKDQASGRSREHSIDKQRDSKRNSRDKDRDKSKSRSKDKDKDKDRGRSKERDSKEKHSEGERPKGHEGSSSRRDKERSSRDKGERSSKDAHRSSKESREEERSKDKGTAKHHSGKASRHSQSPAGLPAAETDEQAVATDAGTSSEHGAHTASEPELGLPMEDQPELGMPDLEMPELVQPVPEQQQQQQLDSGDAAHGDGPHCVEDLLMHAEEEAALYSVDIASANGQADGAYEEEPSADRGDDEYQEEGPASDRYVPNNHSSAGPSVRGSPAPAGEQGHAAGAAVTDRDSKRHKSDRSDRKRKHKSKDRDREHDKKSRKTESRHRHKRSADDVQESPQEDLTKSAHGGEYEHANPGASGAGADAYVSQRNDDSLSFRETDGYQGSAGAHELGLGVGNDTRSGNAQRDTQKPAQAPSHASKRSKAERSAPSKEGTAAMAGAAARLFGAALKGGTLSKRSHSSGHNSRRHHSSERDG